jgi:hypothetical protein
VLADHVIEKILFFYKAFGHQVQSISVDGLSESEQGEQIERFAKEVMPVLRKEIPTSIWRNNNPVTMLHER